MMGRLARREFITAMAAGAAGCRAALAAGAVQQPRGPQRLIYTSDPSNLATMQLGRHTSHKPTAEQSLADPARPEGLTRWVDNLAHNGVDIYAQAVFSQGWSLYFRSQRFEYDARPQHQRFVPMMDAGTTPLDVLIDRAHERGMQFFAKFRMNDGHGGRGQGAKFILDRCGPDLAKGYHYASRVLGAKQQRSPR